MKIISVILLLLCSLYALPTQAQVSWGFKTGYTRAWERYNLELPDNAEITVDRFHVSAMAYLPLNSWLRIGIEPGFAQRGAACIPGWFPTFEGDTKLFLNYVDVPVMASAHLPLWKGRLELFAKGGYGLSVLVKANEETINFETGETLPKTKVPIGRGSRLNTIDTGFHGTGGIAAKFGPGQLLLESSVYAGIRNADRGTTSKNRSLKFSLGYMFHL